MTSTLIRSDTMASNTAVGTIAGRTTRFTQMHRDGNTSPIAFTATVSLPLSVDDVVAALWVITEGDRIETIPVDPTVQNNLYSMVLETIVSNNDLVAQALADVQDIGPRHPDYRYLVDIRAVVAAAFGSGRGGCVA